MKDISIISINILSEAELLVADHQSVKTSYRKKPVQTDFIELGMTGFEDDSVTDHKHHGGNDKAVCCYNADHFIVWRKQLGFELECAAFGENLTITGNSALETNVFIGDRYQLGEAIVEVSEPRGPCFVIGIRYNYKQFPIHLQQTGFTGFYLRTIKPGKVKKDDKLIHIFNHPKQISVMDVNHVRYHDPKNKEWLERLIALEELTEEWRLRFSGMLEKLKAES